MGFVIDVTGAREEISSVYSTDSSVLRGGERPADLLYKGGSEGKSKWSTGRTEDFSLIGTELMTLFSLITSTGRVHTRPHQTAGYTGGQWGTSTLPSQYICHVLAYYQIQIVIQIIET